MKNDETKKQEKKVYEYFDFSTIDLGDDRVVVNTIDVKDSCGFRKEYKK